MIKDIKPLGYRNIALPVTAAAVMANILGVWLTFKGHVDAGMVCLIISGLMDMFDGPLARRQKRSEDEIIFGVELDSLADVINFGFVPPILLYASGLVQWFYLPFFLVYVLSALVRLAYFNVQAIRRIQAGETSKSFVGLPVTSIAASLPVAWLIAQLIKRPWSHALLILVLIVSAVLFISRVRVPKIPKRLYPVVVLLSIIIMIIYACRV